MYTPYVLRSDTVIHGHDYTWLVVLDPWLPLARERATGDRKPNLKCVFPTTWTAHHDALPLEMARLASLHALGRKLRSSYTQVGRLKAALSRIGRSFCQKVQRVWGEWYTHTHTRTYAHDKFATILDLASLVRSQVASAQITAVDRLGMYVLVGMNDGQSGKLRLPFPRAAEDRKDVKNLIVEMTNTAMSSAEK